MWMFILVTWRIMRRLLRRVGWGGLLVPVAAMGLALAGVHFWTLALVLIALAVVIRKPLLAMALLPLSMVAAGLSGLVVAAMSPSGPVTWMVQSLFAKPRLPAAKFSGNPPPEISWSVTKGQQSWTVKEGIARSVTVVGPRGNLFGPKGTVIGPKGTVIGPKGTVIVPSGKVPPGLQVNISAVPQKPVPRAAFFVKGGVPGGPARVAMGMIHSAGPGPGWWQGRLLVSVALLLLTVGLVLAPRMFRGLRPITTARMPELREWLATNRWALLLIPVVAIGMTAFGVQPPLVLAAALAALIIVIRWPVIAADLVPFGLAALAAIGYLIAAHWQAPGLYQHPMFYGGVLVRGPSSALTAGAEASAFLALGAWLVPRTIGMRWRTAESPDADLVGQVARLTESRGHAVDAAAAELRRIERDLHDGAQARLVALGMNLRAV